MKEWLKAFEHSRMRSSGLRLFLNPVLDELELTANYYDGTIKAGKYDRALFALFIPRYEGGS